MDAVRAEALPGQRGQAAVELLGAVPLLVLVGLVGWQLAAVRRPAAGRGAGARRGRCGRPAPGPDGWSVAAARVPAFLPGVGGLRVRPAAAVRAP